VRTEIAISIFNIKGQVIKTLEPLQGPTLQYIWDGKNANGEQLANGIYFCKLTGKFSAIKRIILLK